MKNNSEIATANRFTLTRLFRRAPKALLTTACVTACLAAFSLTTTRAALLNGNFDAAGNYGSLSINPGDAPVIGNLGSGPWQAYLATGNHGNGAFVSIGKSDAGFSGGAAEIDDHNGNDTNAAVFQVLSNTYAANTTYVFKISFSIECFTQGNDTGVIGLGATAGNWSTTTNPFASGLNDNSVAQTTNSNDGITHGTLTFTLNTGTDSSIVGKKMGVYAFTQNPVANKHDVEFDCASVTVVPEPSSFVLAGIFGAGMLILFRRYRQTTEA